MKFVTEIKNGIIPKLVSESLRKGISALTGRFVISIEPWQPKRSVSQNRLYWMWLSEAASQTGYDVNALHEYFKRKFLGMEAIEVNDVLIEVPKSTTSLKVGKMADYLTAVEADLVSAGLTLTTPIDYRFAMFGENK